jgi:hypothetical protein
MVTDLKIIALEVSSRCVALVPAQGPVARPFAPWRKRKTAA